MRDVIEFVVFIWFIIAGILFTGTRGALETNGDLKEVNPLLSLYGYILPFIIYMIFSTCPMLLTVILSLLVIGFYIFLVHNYCNSLSCESFIQRMSENNQKITISNIKRYLLLAPWGAIVYFVIIVLIFSAIEEVAKKKKD